MSWSIKKIILILSFLFLVASGSYAKDPLLYAEPWDNVTTYYRLTINGVEVEENIPAQEETEWVFFFSVGDMYLNEGANEVWIRSCNEKHESPDLKFLIVKRTFKRYIQYEIKLDRKNNKDDIQYKLRFDEPLILKVPIN